MSVQIINVEGMTCGHCVETVTQAVKGLQGIKTVQVDLAKKQVSVDFDERQTGLNDIISKIKEVGFDVPGH